MKTAMQELIDNLIEYGWLPNDASNLKQSFLEPALEKEKEQIRRDFKNGYKSHPFMDLEYYNQFYNQKK